MKVLLRICASLILAQFSWLVMPPGGIHAEDVAAKNVAATENSEQGVLVLRDGGVLEGRVVQVGDRYKVTRGGSEVEIAASRVAFACGSMSEAFDRRRQQITQLTADPHLELADWCLRFNLLDEAASEISEARKIDPGHPRLTSADRRLTHARDRKSRPVPVPQPETKQPESAAIVQTQATIPIESLSGEAVERFTRKVQPILVNNCTAGGCHQASGSQSFKLDRALMHGLANRRSTMHNLSATLALIDSAQPHLSQLLVVSRSTHGGMKEPVFGPNDEAAFRHVMDWVALVTQSERLIEASTTSAEAQQPAAGIDSAIYNSLEDTAADAAEESLFSAKPVLQVGAKATKWQPRDEFDPEIFNRETAARNSTKAPVSTGGTP